jgi:hypothetical protein
VCRFEFEIVSRNCQVVVEVQVNGWHVVIVVDAQLNQLITFVRNSILLKGLTHVKNAAKPFPSVRGSVAVDD